MKVELPTKKTKPVEGIQNYAIYIYGKGGIGKTSFTSMFPNALHLFYEPSGDDLELFAMEPTNWEHFLGIIDKLEEEKEAGTLKFETVIIDIVDICFKQCIHYICDPMGVDYPPSDYGKTWNRIGEEFRNAIYSLKRVMGLVLVSHATERNIEHLDGEKYDTIVPTLTNTGNQVLTKFCGLQMCYMMDMKGNRILRIEPNTVCETKNRISRHFNYSNGDRIHVIPMGKNEKESWKFFNAAYNNKLVKPKKEKENEKTEENKNQNQKTNTNKKIIRRIKK